MEVGAKKIIGQLSESEIEVLRQSHGAVYEIIVPVDDEATGYAACYIGKPNRKLMELVLSMVSNPVKAAEIIMANCWLGGEKTIQTDDDMFLSAVPHILSVIKIRQGEIKKK